MMNNPKLLAASFFVAAALALVAALLRYRNDGELRLSLLAAALFLVAMGIRQVRRRPVRA